MMDSDNRLRVSFAHGRTRIINSTIVKYLIGGCILSHNEKGVISTEIAVVIKIHRKITVSIRRNGDDDSVILLLSLNHLT